ncbi:MBL fold hydrolase [Paenibacillus sp. J31TS4]|uniref:MBL fold metallo-hydrolase n=1 Tax=Paenibacillus sp. J31TS4 TaxID=2807195 RepID=UPI001B13D3EA|nr:MBL fold metallo-hydrolase [Paenibacillus sp. J31TS4]GIP39738.1 MBL fold hydrolase [Paenibacillus sp. J31TS4]
MDLELTMLGTGGAFAKKYANNNALIRWNGVTLLLDCGVTAMGALHQMGVDVKDIDGVVVTHQHADHVGGLEEFAFRRGSRKPRLFVPATLRQKLWEHTLKGGMENPADGLNTLDDYFEVTEIEEGPAQEIVPGLRLQILPTVHIRGKSSYSLLFNDRLFYSSDTTFDEARLKELHARGVETFLHECQLTGKGRVHTTLDELLTLPPAIRERLYLMHYGDNRDEFDGQTAEMRFIEQRKPYLFPLG